MFIETPNETDRVSGGRVQYHPDNPNVFEIITWTNFSKSRNRYNGYVSTWQIAEYIDPETRTRKLGVFFLELHIRYNHYADWINANEGNVPAFMFIPDQHRRRAAKEGRERLGLMRFEQVHTAIPKEEWEKWLVEPSDQVIGKIHTSTLAGGN